MVAACEDRYATGVAYGRQNRFGVSRHDDRRTGIHGLDTLEYADHQRLAGKVAEGFLGEPRRAQTSRDDDERAHRSTASKKDADAKSTPRKIGPCRAERKVMPLNGLAGLFRCRNRSTLTGC
ncbi:hypothetical protein LBMAG44_11410 [Gemmatimonadota bacterium]|nr:hypothetical protein LBMAG44_11410 [Gemmatimonadota bacterium]